MQLTAAAHGGIMGILELFIIAVGLSADAFSVSVCKGLASGNEKKKAALLCGLWFGGFQALMPLIGYYLGTIFVSYIQMIDHWIAFILLSIIGFNMVREGMSSAEEECGADLSTRTMLMLAIATSIDALAVGVTFAFLKVQIFIAVGFIGLCTFAFSFAGVFIGNLFGSRFKNKAQIAGGAILILMGIKILVQHLLGM